MASAAEVAGVLLDRDDVHLDALAWSPTGSGCSAIWCGGSTTVDRHYLMWPQLRLLHHGIQQMFALMSGQPGPEHEPPICSRRYVITSRPDDVPAHHDHHDERAGRLRGTASSLTVS